MSRRENRAVASAKPARARLYTGCTLAHAVEGDGTCRSMKISQKGLYALQAITMLARHHEDGAIKVRDIAQEEGLPPKFLELILLELKHARILDSERGARG